jgi:hypothetical protein
MDPNEIWKNLLLALREGRPVAARDYANDLAWHIAQHRNDIPTGLWRAILESEMSE